MKNSCMHPHLKKNRAFRCCCREEPTHTSEEIWVYVCSSNFIQRWWSFIFLQNIILKEKSYYLRQVAALPNSLISLYCCLLWLSVNIVAPWSLLILSWSLREGCVVLVFHLLMESEYFGGTGEKSYAYCLWLILQWFYRWFKHISYFVLVSRRQTYCTGHSSGMGLSEFSAKDGPCSGTCRWWIRRSDRHQ